MIQLRCIAHMHAKADDEKTEIKCQRCSKRAGKPVYHYWTRRQIEDAQRRGITVIWPRIDPEA